MLMKLYEVKKNNSKYFVCECSKCHELTTHRYDHLNKNEARCICEKNKTNHEYGTRLYQTWRNMINRCERKEHKSYKDYGAKGHKVCDEWRNSYVAFSNWAKANGYRNDLTIERIDPNGDYEPSNCRWATRQEQANNKTSSRFLCLNGEKKTVSEWSRILNIPESTIRNRIYNGKLKGEQILTTRVGYNQPMYKYKGQMYTAKQLKDKCSIPFPTLRYRLTTAKWDVETALTSPSKLGNNQFSNKKEI